MIASNLKVGLLGIGLEAYWEQFTELKCKLEANLLSLSNRLETMPITVINAGLVDTVDKAFEAGNLFRRSDVEIIFLYVGTYALSATVLPAVQYAKVPIIILNLSPAPAIDYAQFNFLGDRTKMTGVWLEYCGACPVPEIANVFKRTGIAFHQVTGLLDFNQDPASWQEIEEWIEAANVAHIMRFNRMGCMGGYYSGMTDIFTDLTLQLKYFGGHFEHIEVEELTALKNAVTPEALQDRLIEFSEKFDIQQDCSLEELQRAARTSVALDHLVQRYKLGSFAYYHKGTGNADNEDTMSSVILGNSLLTERHIPVAGEYEIKNAQAMKIMDSFGAGGSFTEYYAMDYQEDLILMGHDGPGHIAIAEGKTKVKPLRVYHGKVGSGLSVEMAVKNGPVTLLSVVEDTRGGLLLLVAEGSSVPGPILQIGNTNSRYKFDCGAKRFVEAWNEQGPAHHCAVGIGHISAKLEKFAKILGLGYIKVC